MLWDVLYFLDWLICELQELELELEQQELEELGFMQSLLILQTGGML